MENLPDLPKKYKRREAKVDGPVLAWFAKNYPESVAVEVKVGKNKILPHQDAALSEVDKGVFAYKIPDMGRRNPFDGFVLKNAKAFVVTCDGMKCHAVGYHGEEFDFHITKNT